MTDTIKRVYCRYMPTSPTRYDPKRMGNEYLEWYAPHKVFHSGCDLNWGYGNDDEGQEVVAPSDAMVEFVAVSGDNGGLGLYVVLFHPKENLWTRYMHLKSVRAGLQKGQQLAEGEVFAALGRSGTVSAHLHFEVLNQKGLTWVKDWHRAYGRYPGGLSRDAVAAMFLNPMEFLAGKYTPDTPTFTTKFFELDPRVLARRLARKLKRETTCDVRG